MEETRKSSFKTRKVDVDPETGAVTWNVSYDNLHNLDKEVGDTTAKFLKVLKQYPEDEKLAEFYNIFVKFRKALRSHITRNYKNK